MTRLSSTQKLAAGSPYGKEQRRRRRSSTLANNYKLAHTSSRPCDPVWNFSGSTAVFSCRPATRIFEAAKAVQAGWARLVEGYLAHRRSCGTSICSLTSGMTRRRKTGRCAIGRAHGCVLWSWPRSATRSWSKWRGIPTISRRSYPWDTGRKPFRFRTDAHRMRSRGVHR